MVAVINVSHIYNRQLTYWQTLCCRLAQIVKQWHNTNAQILLQVVVVKDLAMAKKFRLTTSTLCLTLSKGILQDMRKKTIAVVLIFQAVAMIIAVLFSAHHLLILVLQVLIQVHQAILVGLVVAIMEEEVQVATGKKNKAVGCIRRVCPTCLPTT